MSSIIKSYRKVDEGTLEISLTTGKTYLYDCLGDVDAIIYDLDNAASKGRYYNYYIKGQYLGVRVEETDNEEVVYETNTTLAAANLIKDLKEGTVIVFGTKQGLEDLLRVLRLDDTIHFNIDSILSTYNKYFYETYLHDSTQCQSVILINGYLQLVDVREYDYIARTHRILSLGHYNTNQVKTVTRDEIMGVQISFTTDSKDTEVEQGQETNAARETSQETAKDSVETSTNKPISNVSELITRHDKAFKDIEFIGELLSSKYDERLSEIKDYITYLERNVSI